MPLSLCGECYLQSYCRRLRSRIVTADEVTPRFIRDVRGHMRGLGLTRDRWLPFLLDAYQDYPGLIVDTSGEEAYLDTSVFDHAGVSYWFRDMCRKLPPHVQPRLRREARERFIVTASILRAIHPVPARLWGKEIANDHDAAPVPISRSETGCPHLGRAASTIRYGRTYGKH